MKAFYIGQRPYRGVLRFQEKLFKAKIERQLAVRRAALSLPLLTDVVLLLEHVPPVYTVGRRDTSVGLPTKAKIDVVKTHRGGGITYHGPGQLTMYPIANIVNLWKGCTREKVRSPIEWFSDVLERAMIDTASHYHIPAHAYKTGVWADAYKECRACKLGSIGLQLGNGVSMHGASLNLDVDLTYFDDIVMCEMPDKRATSVAQQIQLRGLTLQTPTVEQASPVLYRNFISCLGNPKLHEECDIVDLSRDDEWQATILDSVEALQA